MSGKRSFIFRLSPTSDVVERHGVALTTTMTTADGIGANFLEAPSWLSAYAADHPATSALMSHIVSPLHFDCCLEVKNVPTNM